MRQHLKAVWWEGWESRWGATLDWESKEWSFPGEVEFVRPAAEKDAAMKARAAEFQVIMVPSS